MLYGLWTVVCIAKYHNWASRPAPEPVRRFLTVSPRTVPHCPRHQMSSRSGVTQGLRRSASSQPATAMNEKLSYMQFILSNIHVKTSCTKTKSWNFDILILAELNESIPTQWGSLQKPPDIHCNGRLIVHLSWEEGGEEMVWSLGHRDGRTGRLHTPSVTESHIVSCTAVYTLYTLYSLYSQPHGSPALVPPG